MREAESADRPADAPALDVEVIVKMTRIESVDELLVHEVQDLYSAEEQLIAALPLMASAATAPELREGFEAHLNETRTQLRRAEQALLSLDEKPSGETCEAMQGLIEEGQKLMKSVERGPVLDAALLDAGRKVEHYEIVAYRAAIAKAYELGQVAVASLLEMSLQEEELADHRLQRLAEGMMPFSGPGDDPRADGSVVITRSV